MRWLKQLVTEIAGIRELSMDQDLFEAGVDSLQVLKMARELKFQGGKAGLGGDGADQVFTPTAIYQNPKLRRLASFIFRQARVEPLVNVPNDGHVNGHAKSQVDDQASDQVNGHQSYQNSQALLDTYASGLPQSVRSSSLPSTERMIVVLSGSTGSLGSYLLEALYHNRNVDQIVCLNRSIDARDKHNRIGPKRGLTTNLDPDRVEFLQADLSLPQFGLEAEVYERMLQTVTHIIHNQWPVNFNWSVSSFEPHIRGVRNLIDFSIDSVHNSFLLFVSSVSAVGAWHDPENVPERPIHDLGAASMGYVQSKLIAECLLDKAADISGVRSACCRVGIVAGPVERSLGMWNRHEYVPSIIISSAHLGVFPATFPSRDRIDWLPVDKVAAILIDILTLSCAEVLDNESHRTQLYHVVNPNTILWSTLVPWVLAAYPEGVNMKVIPFEEWLKVLEQSSEESADLERNPAVKLLEFYRDADTVERRPRRLKLERSGQARKILEGVEAVNQDWVRNWMQQWGY